MAREMGRDHLREVLAKIRIERACLRECLVRHLLVAEAGIDLGQADDDREVRGACLDNQREELPRLVEIFGAAGGTGPRRDSTLIPSPRRSGRKTGAP